MRPLVLVIAGLDSGGGAGLSADALTIFDLGSWALPCASAVTAQSLKEVAGCQAVDPELFDKSLKLAARDYARPVAAIKIGLITSAKILEITLKALEHEFKGVPVVWDPVLTATAGRLDSADLKGKLKLILKHVTVFTPNLPEALALAGWDNQRLEREGVAALGRVFVKAGARAVIIKGGHVALSTSARDVFVSPDLEFVMTSPRLKGDGAHGGGCALSSALAALLAQGYAPFDAAVMAKAYVLNGIADPVFADENGRPPVGHHGRCRSLEYFPAITEAGFPESAGPFAPCPEELGLYPVVDSVPMLERLLAVGVKTIQLRIKDKNDPKLYDKIERAAYLGRAFRARVFIDDHYELAIKAGAYGVHLGMEDLRTADLKAIQDAGLRLGVSTHGLYEVLKALSLKPSYIALGHIFPTQTKQMPSKPQGLLNLAYEAQLLKGVVPTVAIGGIKLDKAREVLDCGVGSIALITGITKAEDPLTAAQLWLTLVSDGLRERKTHAHNI